MFSKTSFNSTSFSPTSFNGLEVVRVAAAAVRIDEPLPTITDKEAMQMLVAVVRSFDW